MPVSTQVDAKKAVVGRDAAIQLARQAAEIVAAKGTKVVRLDLKKDKPTDEAIAALIIGPSGNLRAPAIRIGKTLIVGFDPEMYAGLVAG